MSESLEYLENFWIPSVGSSVSFNEEPYSIHSFASEDCVQVFLEKNGQCTNYVYFVQDLIWAPRNSDIENIFKRLGFLDCGDAWYLDCVYYPKTEDIEINCKSLMQARARRLELPSPDLILL